MACGKNNMIRALFLGDPTVSHTFDTFYHGMCELLGKTFVHDYPCYPKYHTNHKIPGDKYSWWCYTDNNENTLSLTLDGWADEINNGKIKYIFFTNRGSGPEHLFVLLSLIKTDVFKDICITFIEEEHDLDFSMHKSNVAKLMPFWDKIDIYYRMDFIQDKVFADKKIYPLYIGMPENKMALEVDNIKSFYNKKYDICYMVGASHPNRKKYYDILKSAELPGNNIIEYGDHKYSINNYFNIINDSKIFISVRGAEYHNTRNIEGPYLGAALFSEHLPTTVPFDYTHGESCIYFNEDNLIQQLKWHLQNLNVLNKLADNGKAHCSSYHTTLARAEQFVITATDVKGW